MKWISAVVFSCLVMNASWLPAAGRIGDAAPTWQYLPGTDGKLHSSSDHQQARVIVVVFLCNKCPCARGYDARFSKFVDQYATQGVRLIGINANTGPTETMEEMKKRAAAGEYKFEYLRDSNQSVARGFHARSTPHAFVLDADRKIVYAGAFDDNRSEAKVTNHYVIDAVNSVLQGQKVAVSSSQQFGCAITYK